MKLSVIIPCFNAADTIVAQLEAFAHQEWSEPWELILVDNGSTDNTVALIEQYLERLPNLKVIDASERRGAAFARNTGAKAATGEALAFCDADDEVAPGWVAGMGEALAHHDFVGGRCEHWKLNPPWLVEGYQNEAGTGIMEHPYLPLVGGNNLGVKRSLFDSLAGFDESFTLLQDVDFCWRAQQAGTKIHYVPQAIVHFRFRNSLRSNYQRARNMGRQEVFLFQKHELRGMPKGFTWQRVSLNGIKLLLKFLWRVRDKPSLARWLMEFAWWHGNLRGFIKYRYSPF